MFKRFEFLLNRVKVLLTDDNGHFFVKKTTFLMKNFDQDFLKCSVSGNRKKFKRCIYKELKIYERQHPETVKAECTVKGTYY